MIVTLEWPADNVPDFFFVPCAPFTHEPRGKCIDGVWRITFTREELVLLLEVNKYNEMMKPVVARLAEETENGADF